MVVAMLVAGVGAAVHVSGSRTAAPMTPASQPADPLATAREDYLELAADSNKDFDRLRRTAKNGVTPAEAPTYFRDYAAALRSFDKGLRAITFPANAQPHVIAILADDDQLVAGFDRVVKNPGCACDLAALTAVRDRRTADANKLRAALGLPPST